MSWFKVDDSFPQHRKVLAIPRKDRTAAVGLWTLAGTWCASQLTDGHLGEHMIVELASSPRIADLLVKAGLWEEVEDGYQIHDYLDYNPTADEVRAEQARKHEAKARAGRAGGIASGVARRKHARSTDEADAKQTESETKPRPDPSSSKEEESAKIAEDPREDVEGLCEHLHRRIVANGSRVNITGKWRDSARLLIDRDRRTPSEAHALIDWCQESEFWRANIRSMPKFREQYDTLRLQAQARGGLRLTTVGGERSWSTAELEAILGVDLWRCPQPPSGMSANEMWEWEQRVKREHRAERVRQAEAKIGRSA